RIQVIDKNFSKKRLNGSHHTMSETKIYPIPDALAKSAHINAETYQRMYQQSIEKPASFWAEQAEEFLHWAEPWTNVCEFDFVKGQASWFKGGKLNVSVNCIDRHLPQRAGQTAIIWEGDDPSQDKHITYEELYNEVCRFANVLKARGVKKGDRVCI